MPIHMYDDERAAPESSGSRVDLISVRTADLAERRRVIEATVETLLPDWPGDGATDFAAQWQAWSQGAAMVVEALAANVTALRHANEQILAVDLRPPCPREGGC